MRWRGLALGACVLSFAPFAAAFISKTEDYLKFLIPQYAKEGKSYLTIGIGCTGGKHRSVFLAEEMAQHLKSQLEGGFSITVEHQDLRLSSR